MKDQYFGDINDYKKFGLLRSIQSVADIQILIAWMLTPDDGSTDGKFTEYLSKDKKWEKYDPLLFQELKALTNNTKRQVSLIEKSTILKNCTFFSNKTPDKAAERNVWFSSLLSTAENSDLIFLDPDNGLEIKSKPYGRVNSSKFLYWHEVTSLWSSGKSLLIYQHFIREKRETFTNRMLVTLSEHTDGSLVEAFSTSNVLFLMALQPKHKNKHAVIVDAVNNKWCTQITPNIYMTAQVNRQ